MTEYAGQNKVSKEIAEKVRKANLPGAKKAAEKKRKLKSVFYYATLLKKNKENEKKQHGT
jgi:hypothetical protein